MDFTVTADDWAAYHRDWADLDSLVDYRSRAASSALRSANPSTTGGVTASS